MAQPVRQNIIESRPELANKPFFTLLIDGNALLRQCMVDTKVNAQGVHYGGIFQNFIQQYFE